MGNLSGYEPSNQDYEQTFKYRGERDKYRTSWKSLVSEVRVENLLFADRHLLSLFCILSTWNSVGWYKFKNMDTLTRGTKEYFHQWDMNRVVHTFVAVIDELSQQKEGRHDGDCVSQPCSCDRCRAEVYYFQIIYLKEQFEKKMNLGREALDTKANTAADTEENTEEELLEEQESDLTAREITKNRNITKEIIAMLLARDELRIELEENFRKAMTPVGEEAKKCQELNSGEWYDLVYAKYPCEYDIDVDKHIEYWKILKEGNKASEPFLTRAEQIMDWCELRKEKRPVCPGVPWWK